MSGLESILMGLGTSTSGTALGSGAAAGLGTGAAAAGMPAGLQAGTAALRGAGALGAGLQSQQAMGGLMGGDPGAMGRVPAPGGAPPGGGFDTNAFVRQLGGMAGQAMQSPPRSALPGPTPGGGGSSPFSSGSSPFRSRQGPQSGDGLMAEMFRYYGGGGGGW
jgi:hypothetical protein